MLSRRQFLAAGGVAATVSCGRKKGTGIRAFAFVANSGGKAVAVADLSAFTVARFIRLPGGEESQPTAVIAPPDHPSVFVLTPASGSLHALSVEQLSYQRALRVGQIALKMLLSADGKAIYVLLAQPRKLVRISLERFAVEAEHPLPLLPADFDLSLYHDRAVIAFANGSFSSLDFASGALSKPLSITSDLGGIRFQSDGNAFLVADRSARSLHVYDAASLGRIAELPLAVRPDNLCFSADGGQLFVTGEGADAVCVVYHYHTPQVAETVLAGRHPGAMAASGSPAYLFVANPSSGDVSILNVRDRKMIAVVGVGAEPGYITVTPDNAYTLVLNQKSGDMAVLRVGGIQRNRQKSASLFTMIPVGTSPVSAAVRMV